MNLATAGKVRSPMVPAVVKVRAAQRETHDVVTLALDLPDPDFAFLPGQFNMLYVFGVGEAAISMSGRAAETQHILHTIRTVGSVTNALGRLDVGASIGLRGPFGSAWPVQEARGQDVVIVAGGIGLAPLRPVLYHLLRHRADYGQVVLLYGARTPADVLFSSELAQWHKGGALQVFTTVDRGDASWRGSVGLVTVLFSQVKMDPGRTIGLICGPEIMMRFVQRAFEKQGVADDRLYVSLERNMHCAVGFCGHCQFGPEFVCMDGPVFRYDRIQLFFNIREA
jgi:NAD(P)H-flavin reductase